MKEKKIQALSIENESHAALIQEDIEKLSKLEDLKLKQLDYSLKKEELEGNTQDREERKRFANKIFIMIVTFLFSVITIVICCAIKCLPFSLSETILVTLLSTTSINVIGLFLVVVKYLFSAKIK